MTSDAPDPSQLEAGDALASSNTNIPKRKPVPAAPAQPPLASDKPISPPTIAVDKETEQDTKEPDVEYSHVKDGSHKKASKFAIPLSLAALDKLRLGPLEKFLPYDARRRRYIIAGGIAGIIALLALIIGLAAGLTAGKR